MYGNHDKVVDQIEQFFNSILENISFRSRGRLTDTRVEKASDLADECLFRKGDNSSSNNFKSRRWLKHFHNYSTRGDDKEVPGVPHNGIQESKPLQQSPMTTKKGFCSKMSFQTKKFLVPKSHLYATFVLNQGILWLLVTKSQKQDSHTSQMMTRISDCRDT